MFARLKEKSAVVQGHVTIPLRSDFTPEDVPETAKETASNWFYKAMFSSFLIRRYYFLIFS